MANVKKIYDVGVNLDAVKTFGYKTVSELKAEPGKMFSHLSATDEEGAYTELAKELGITETGKPVPTTKGTAS